MVGKLCVSMLRFSLNDYEVWVNLSITIKIISTKSFNSPKVEKGPPASYVEREAAKKPKNVPPEGAPERVNWSTAREELLSLAPKGAKGGQT